MQPSGPPLPVPTRAADAFGVLADGEAELVVLPGWLRVGVLGDADRVPGINPVGISGPLSRDGFSVAGGHVDLTLHCNRPLVHQVRICRALVALKEGVKDFADREHCCRLQGAAPQPAAQRIVYMDCPHDRAVLPNSCWGKGLWIIE